MPAFHHRLTAGEAIGPVLHRPLQGRPAMPLPLQELSHAVSAWDQAPACHAAPGQVQT